MVLLTTSFIEKKYSHNQSQKSLTKKQEKNYLSKMTHLYMDNKYLDAIGNISICKNLRVIYLHNNNITKLENLNFAINLTHLYLQHNNIEKCDNLHEFKNLTHLFLGYNCINVVEGMENLEKLNQLHVEYQRLPIGESLIFDPRAIYSLSNQLKVLNTAGNNLTSLDSLHYLDNLEILDARNNMIDDLLELSKSVKQLRSLRQLFLQNNPVTNHYKYWKNIISNSASALVDLDDKVINETTRYFLNKFANMQQLRLEKQKNYSNLSDNITASLNLPPAFKKSVSRAILQQNLGPKLSINDVEVSAAGEMKPQIFPPWKTLPSISWNKNLRMMPRPFLKSTRKKNTQSSNINDTGMIKSVHARIEKYDIEASNLVKKNKFKIIMPLRSGRMLEVKFSSNTGRQELPCQINKIF